MRNRFLLAALVALVSNPVVAERVPGGAGQDRRVQVVKYHAADVVRVNTNLKINTAIELGAGQVIRSVLLGDSDSFEVDGLSSRNVLAIKPVTAGAATNMTVYTESGAFYFSLLEGRTSVPVYRVAFDYPDQRRNRGGDSSAKTSVFRSVGFGIAGEGKIRPSYVWSDGTHTFFKFENRVRPSIFAANDQGEESIVNSMTRSGVVRVDSTSEFFVIRMGQDVVCIKQSAPKIAEGSLNETLAYWEGQMGKGR